MVVENNTHNKIILKAHAITIRGNQFSTTPKRDGLAAIK